MKLIPEKNLQLQVNSTASENDFPKQVSNLYKVFYTALETMQQKNI